MTRIGIFGTSDKCNLQIARGLYNYIKEPLNSNINIKTQYSIGKFEGCDSEKIITPIKLELIEDESKISHFIFVPGTDPHRTVINIGIITVARVADFAIAMFAVDLCLRDQFKFFDTIRVFPEAIRVCISNFDILNDSDKEYTIEQMKQEIQEYFEKRNMKIIEFFNFASTDKVEFTEMDNQTYQGILNIICKNVKETINQFIMKIGLIGDTYYGNFFPNLNIEKITRNKIETIGVTINALSIMGIHDNSTKYEFKLNLFNIMGSINSTTLQSMLPTYISRATAIIIIIDLSRKIRLERINRYFKTIDNNLIFIVGINKDLSEEGVDNEKNLIQLLHELPPTKYLQWSSKDSFIEEFLRPMLIKQNLFNNESIQKLVIKYKEPYRYFPPKYNSQYKALLQEPLCFLVGAGISVGSPSLVPAAKAVIKKIFEFCIPSEFSNMLLSNESLRFEMIIETLQMWMDQDLRFMDYYELSKTPNLIHLFLADKILAQVPVITTNFDYLIELAVKHLMGEQEQSNFIPVITQKDFLDIQEQTRPIFLKIHGSMRNIITGENTKQTLIMTMKSLGIGKTEEMHLDVESFKKKIMEKILENKTLVVMGYSGRDDFDIGPFLLSLKTIRNVIWVDHIDSDTMDIKQFDRNSGNDSDLSLLHQFLFSLRSNNNADVFCIQCNTQKFIEQNFISNRNYNPPIQSNPQEINISFLQSIENLYKNVPIPIKYAIAITLFSKLGMLSAMKICINEALELNLDKTYAFLQFYFKNSLGDYYSYRGMFLKAQSAYYDAYCLADRMKDKNSIIENLIKLSSNLIKQGYFNQASIINEKIHTLLQTEPQTQNEINLLIVEAELKIAQNNYEQATTLLENAKKLNNEFGNFEVTIKIMYLLGWISIYEKSGVAFFNFHECLDLVDKIGDTKYKAKILLGMACSEDDDLDFKYKFYFDSYKQARITGDLTTLAKCFEKIGEFLTERKIYDEALDYLKEGIALKEEIGDYQNLSLLYTQSSMIESNELWKKKAINEKEEEENRAKIILYKEFGN